MSYESGSTAMRKRNRRWFLLAACLWAATCSAQEFQFGAALGYGAYRHDSVFAPAGEATASIVSRFTASVVLEDDLYDYISGELRYLYQDGDPFISSGGVKSNVNGQSHAIDYSLLFHFRPRGERFRPYVSGGMGIKGYVVSGPAPFPQAFPQIATLNSTDQWMLDFTPGAGVKYAMGHHVILRFDFRDYITRFPKNIIMAAPHGTDRGLFNQFTPMVGISYVFPGGN